jgi:NADP-reducing hydrogenase subunit HndB
MTKIKSLNDLRAIKAEVEAKMNLRERSDAPEKMIQVKVAMATCGIASGAKTIMDYLISEFDKRSIQAIVSQTGCMGYCYAEPTIEVTIPGKDPIVFGYVTEKKADQIIEKYILNGELVEGIIPVNYESIDNK